jgi:transcriptional regulator with XRE-family HTH domain
MFCSYNLSDFGNAVRELRKRNGFSQIDVKSYTGINQDTLRRIENGAVIPKYETLEILSSIYKSDLMTLLKTFRVNKYFYNYYNYIDRIIANNEIYLLEKIQLDLLESIEKPEHLKKLINPIELRQFELLLCGIKKYNSNNYDEYKEAEQILIDSLKLTLKNFHLDIYNQLYYNLLEVRILFLISLIKVKLREISVSTEILIFVLNYLIHNSDFDNDVQKVILKCYSNISYNFHKIDNHNLALNYATEGIDYAIKNCNMNCLYVLFARKGVAEFFLKQNGYIDSLKKSIHILEINKQYELANLYKSTFENKYNINIE